MTDNLVSFITVLSICSHFAVGIDVTIRGVGTVSGNIVLFLTLQPS